MLSNCKYCNKEILDKEFCSKSCAISFSNIERGLKKRVNLICRNCGKQFVVAYGLRNKKFCSLNCFKSWEHDGKHNSMYGRNKRPLNKCLTCGKETYNDKCCSHTCEMKFRNSLKYPKSVISCLNCRKEFIVLYGQYKGGRKFCSQSCATEFRVRKHYLDYPKVTLNCANCDKAFVVNYRQRTRQFCSKKCSNSCQITKKKPNLPEKELICIFQKYSTGEWRYVGNGEVWLGRRNPDYINTNGKKAVIEHLGCYWHGCSICFPELFMRNDEQELIKHYEKYGFHVLTIWEHELKDEQKVITKIKEFENAIV